MRKRRPRERGALDLIEEAVHLLRSCSASGAAWYALGTLPFLCALLYFWADMSGGAFAHEHATEAALGVAVLFIWMKFGQAIFSAKLGATLSGEVVELNSRRIAQIALFQAIVQPTKLFILPIAALITLPFARAFAFYENVTTLGDAGSVRALIGKAARLGKLWPRQNHFGLLLLLLFSFFAFANVALLLLLAPHLFKIITGVETVFTRSGLNVLNTTFLAATAAITYVCCDPLIKAVYVLRCFYGESLNSGEDLRVELRRAALVDARLVAIVIGLALVCSVGPARGEGPAPSPSRTWVQAPELDRAISETINRPEFSWRMRRENLKTVETENPSFFAAVGRWTGKVVRKIGNWIKDLVDWLDRHLSRRPPGNEPTPGGLKSGFAGSSRLLLYACLVVATGIALFLLARFIRQRRRPDDLAAEPIAATKVDLANEAVTADQLPEDEWLALARTLIAQKEFRFAMRALFLAGLAHLAQRQIVSLAKHKSNREYAAEVRRRAQETPAVQAAFNENLLQVERAWYGRHEVTAETVDRFHVNLEQIRAS